MTAMYSADRLVDPRRANREAEDMPDKPTTGVASTGADEAITALYSSHYVALVRLATWLLHDSAVAEEVVQESFVAVHGRWHRLRDTDKALAYLRTTVVNGCRSALRRRVVADRNRPRPPDPAASAESHVVASAQRTALLAALAQLPRRQREVLLLRYYLDLSEAEIADTLRISRGAVKSHSSRGIAALRTTWKD
ncbi:MAG: SigE family RNA polymerase sigma factor [Nocardioidaceae bacterium]